MARQKTKKKSPAAASRSRAKKPTKKSAKLPGFFSFGNRKFIAIVILVIAVAGLGSYRFYSARAASDGKTTFPTVSQCYAYRPYLYEWVKRQSACTKTVQQFLNVDKFRHNSPYAYLTVDGIYGPRTTEAVKFYQKRTYIPQYGRVNTETWNMMRSTCINAQYISGSLRNSYANVCGKF